MVRKKAEQKKGFCLKSGKTFIGRGPRQDGARHGPEGARPEGSMSPRLQWDMGAALLEEEAQG